MLAELAGEKGLEFFQRERLGAGAQFDEGLRRLAAIVVGDADHDHFLHRRMGVDRLLDHLRIDVEAAGDDHVLLAVDQIEIAVLVHVADIAGQKAVADKGFRGFLGPAPISLGDVRTANADLADLAHRHHLLRVFQRRHIQFDAGQHQPDRARLVRAFLRMAGAGRAGLGHAPAALELHVGLALEDPRHFDRQRRAAGAAAHQRRQIASVEIGQARDRDPHRGNAGEYGGALDLDVAHHGFDIETLVQRDQIAALHAAQQDHGQRVNMKQRQDTNHALDRVAFGAGLLAPDIVDRHRRGQIAVAEHRALRQPGGAAGILQQRHVIDIDRGPLRWLHGAFDELTEGHDRRMVRQRGLRRADFAPVIVLTDDQAVEQALVEEL